MTSHETDAELYHNAMTAVVESWIDAHPESYRRMNDGVMRDWKPMGVGSWRRRMAYLYQCVAEAAGFPGLAVWLNRRLSTSETERAA